MFLEFLPDGSSDCPLVIFSPSVPEDAKQLYLAISKMDSVSGTFLDIHTLPLISPVDGCELSAQVSTQDLGVVPKNKLDVVLSETKNHLNWKLTKKTWSFVLELLYSFTIKDSGPGTYQWLDDTSQISVLISRRHRSW